MELERCCMCDDPTGKAGRSDDSIYKECVHAFQAQPNPDGATILPGEEVGPLCGECYEKLMSHGFIEE